MTWELTNINLLCLCLPTDVANQEGRPEAVEMLYELITSIISCSSSQKIMFTNEVAVKEILTSLQSLLVGEMLKKVHHCF